MIRNIARSLCDSSASCLQSVDMFRICQNSMRVVRARPWREFLNVHVKARISTPCHSIVPPSSRTVYKVARKWRDNFDIFLEYFKILATTTWHALSHPTRISTHTVTSSSSTVTPNCVPCRKPCVVPSVKLALRVAYASIGVNFLQIVGGGSWPFLSPPLSSLPLPFPLLPSPFPPSLPSLPLSLEVGPPNPARGSGGAEIEFGAF